jgi:hypothetical protein
MIGYKDLQIKSPMIIKQEAFNPNGQSSRILFPDFEKESKRKAPPIDLGLGTQASSNGPFLDNITPSKFIKSGLDVMHAGSEYKGRSLHY